MNRKITGLMSVCIGMAFWAVPMMGQKRAEAVVKGEIREVKVLEKTSAKALDVQLRAAAQPWPDSTITYDAADRMTSKTVYTYDGAGNEILYEYFAREDNAWVASVKGIHEYDAAGNLTLHEAYDWKNNAWVGFYKHTSTFDNRGEAITTAHYDWNNGQWVVSVTYYYEKKTVNPKVHVYRGEYPDGWTAIFISCFSRGYTCRAEEKYEYKSTYDAKGNLTLVETSGLGYEGNSPRSLYERYVIKYGNDNPVSVEEYSGNNDVRRRVTYKYDAGGNNTLFESYEWDGGKNTLTLRSQRVTAYDAAGREILSESYDDRQGTGQWVSGYKY
ncbi:MAG: hypothetical protein LBT50_01770, partial [Prevotellaceae bacterium]|nr:hypothetical protein [Prevotellaceae bacterium]